MRAPIERDDRMQDTNKSIWSDQMLRMAERITANHQIDSELYTKYDVKRGLRDINGKGVLAGLTEISEIISYTVVDMEMIPCEGRLYYQGINVEDLVSGFMKEKRFGFEETIFLLLFGSLPTEEELVDFKRVLVEKRELPNGFTRDIIMKAPSPDIMNAMSRSVLALYSYDKRANDTSVPNVLDQCLGLISVFPRLAVYSYVTYNHFYNGKSLIIHSPDPSKSLAENFLHMLRPDNRYTELEARILDLALVLHAEHGGGNNSTFVDHVVTSSGTDTYSAIAASLGSLKGPKHGGANIKVTEMFDDLKACVKDWNDEEEIANYLKKLLHKEAFDRLGLIYGMGHAVYSVSDPRAKMLKMFVEDLANEKGLNDELKLYKTVERLAPEIIARERKIYKGVCINVDFYSGFIYDMLNLPHELYTPMFAMARIAGWSAHRLEEIVNGGKIIRPAYKAVNKHQDYISLESREYDD